MARIESSWHRILHDNFASWRADINIVIVKESVPWLRSLVNSNLTYIFSHLKFSIISLMKLINEQFYHSTKDRKRLLGNILFRAWRSAFQSNGTICHENSIENYSNVVFNSCLYHSTSRSRTTDDLKSFVVLNFFWNKSVSDCNAKTKLKPCWEFLRQENNCILCNGKCSAYGKCFILLWKILWSRPLPKYFQGFRKTLRRQFDCWIELQDMSSFFHPWFYWSTSFSIPLSSNKFSSLWKSLSMIFRCCNEQQSERHCSDLCHFVVAKF